MKISYVLIVLLLVSCSSAGRKERSGFQKLVSAGNFDGALSLLESKDFYKEEKSRLLFLMERGILLHMKGDYFQSVETLGKAKELSKKLYTVSLSKKAQKLIANDSYDIFYGEKFERSLIHFYLSLNHYLLYQKGSREGYTITPKKKDEKPKIIPEKILTADEKRTELIRARAEVLAWDSFLKTTKNERKGKTVYKDDLLAKVYGGFIHELMNTRNDDQIAMQLYKDAKKLLFKNYNRYRVFNKSHAKFTKDYKKLPKLKKSKIKKDYIQLTDYQKNLKDYLDEKILTLVNKMRPNQFKKQVKIQKPSKEILAKVKKRKSLKRSNVSVLFQKGMIPKKMADKHYYSLENAMNGPDATTGSKVAGAIGSVALTLFAAKQLGILSPPTAYNPGKDWVGLNLTQAAVNGASIAFELPMIENKRVSRFLWLVVEDKSGKEIKRKRIPVVQPLGEIAREAVAEHASSVYSRVGVRLATKHITAIVASYGTYKLIKKSSGEFFAKSAAVIQYLGASKAIANSERADTRHWSALPSTIRMTDLYLKPGDYILKVIQPNTSEKAKGMGPVWSQALHVEKKKKYLLNARTLH